MESLLETRPIYHRTDEPIRGHLFCSSSWPYACVPSWSLGSLPALAVSLESSSILRDLERLGGVEIEKQGTRILLGTELQGVALRVLQAVGVATQLTSYR